MAEVHSHQLSSPNPKFAQKRQRSDQLQHPITPPARFWDNLTRSVLTKNALRELERRLNAEGAPQIDCSSRGHPVSDFFTSQTRGSGSSAQQSLQRSSPDRAQLKRYARHGGPDLKDLRGYRIVATSRMSASQSSLGRRKRGSQSATSNTATTKSTGPYDGAFLQHLIDYNIYPPDYEYPNGDELPEPDNLEEIRRRLEEPRASLSPSRFSKQDYKKFKRADAHAKKKSRVIASVIPIIEGDAGDRGCVASETPFTNLDHLTDGSLVCAKPDIYYGSRPEQLNKRIREVLGNLVVPSTQKDLPVLPNNFLQVKGPDGSLSVATRQALYNVTLGSRGFSSLQSHGTAASEMDNKAHALAWTYHGGTLKAYASHAFQPSTDGMPPHYAMTPVDSWCLTGNYESFRRGAAAFRNGKEWTKAERDSAIARANEKAIGSETDSHPHGDVSLLKKTSTRAGGETAERNSSPPPSVLRSRHL